MPRRPRRRARPTAGAAASTAAIAAAAFWCWPAPAAIEPRFARLARIPCDLEGGPGVALTFDDGPHPEGTPAILEALAEAGAVATFFLVGEQVERWPEVAASVAAAGHEIGLHGYRHRLLLRRPTPLLERDLERALRVIDAATGVRPAVYRPPYGVFSAGALALVRRRGLRPLLWSRWGRDWAARERPEKIARRAAEGLVPGDVVLLHDADHYSSPGSWRRTAAALPSVFERASRLGEPFVAVSQST